MGNSAPSYVGTGFVPVEVLPLFRVFTVSKMAVTREEFVAVFDVLCKELVEEVKNRYEMPPHAVQWLEKLLRTAVPGGKMNRGMTVANSLALLKENVTEEEKKKAMILGWCIEWLQGFFLVADDLMDQSITR